MLKFHPFLYIGMKLPPHFTGFSLVRCRSKYLEFGECNRRLRKLNNFYNIQILFRYSNKICVIGWAFGTHHRKYEVWVQVFFGGGGISCTS